MREFKNITLFIVVSLISINSFALPTGKLQKLLRRGLELDPKKVTKSTIIKQEETYTQFLLNELKSAPLKYGVSNIDEIISAISLSDIKSESVINQLVRENPFLANLLINIYKSGATADLKEFASNIKYYKFVSINYQHVMLDPNLITGLGEETDRRIMSLSLVLMRNELINLKNFSHTLLLTNYQDKQIVEQIVDMLLIIAKDTNIYLFNDYTNRSELYYADLVKLGNALSQTITQISEKTNKKLERQEILTIFKRHLNE